jgi:DNA (cytosine-5)-methyltransferase 1
MDPHSNSSFLPEGVSRCWPSVRAVFEQMISPAKKLPSNVVAECQGELNLDWQVKLESAPQLSCVDLFAGCGGLSLGLEEAGFSPLLFCEINKDAASTYLANRKKAGYFQYSDVSSLTNEKIKRHVHFWKENGIEDVDLVCGGPPCQGYSGIGHRRTFKLDKQDIPSNHLFKEMVRVIQAIRPRMFLFENVRGLMVSRWKPDGEKGEIFEEVLKTLSSIKGYGVRWQLVYAKDYGVPQNRPRLLIVGVRNDVLLLPPAKRDDVGNVLMSAVADGLLPKGAGNPPDLIDAFGDLLDPDYLSKRATDRYPSGAKTRFQKEIRTEPDGKIARKGDLLTEQEYSQHADDIRDKFQHMIDNDGKIPEHMQTKKFAQRVLPARWRDGGPNITATSLPEDYVHYCQPRALTVREWARLQTFPDHYIFKGPRTTGGRRRAGDPGKGIWDRDVPKYTQIGNAVPVRLACQVGLKFAEILKGK